AAVGELRAGRDIRRLRDLVLVPHHQHPVARDDDIGLDRVDTTGQGQRVRRPRVFRTVPRCSAVADDEGMPAAHPSTLAAVHRVITGFPRRQGRLFRYAGSTASSAKTRSVRAMALNNPAFNNPAFQDPRAVQTYPGGPQAGRLGGSTQCATAKQQSVDTAANAQLEGAFAAPPAGAIETGRMTVEDTVFKTLGLFAVLLVTAVAGWIWTMSTWDGTVNTSPTMMPWIIGMLGGFVLAMVVIFTSRKKIRPGLILAYAAFEGLFV